jgi:hypothetical protein
MGFLDDIKKGLEAAGSSMAEKIKELSIASQERVLLEQRIKTRCNNKFNFVNWLKRHGVQDPIDYKDNWEDLFRYVLNTDTLKRYLDEHHVNYDDIELKVKKSREEFEARKKALKKSK